MFQWTGPPGLVETFRPLRDSPAYCPHERDVSDGDAVEPVILRRFVLWEIGSLPKFHGRSIYGVDVAAAIDLLPSCRGGQGTHIEGTFEEVYEDEGRRRRCFGSREMQFKS